MIHAFTKHIETQFPYLKNTKLILAISGGRDSVALAHLLHTLDYDFTMAHVNFKLRGEASDTDEAFVKNLANELNTPCLIKHFNTKHYAQEKGVSIQMAARDLRYDWFNALAQENNFGWILTAHHLDDALETFLINLTRGTGLKGLTGIPANNNNIIRPLLAFSRDEITNYCTENNISWREDQSNSETKYTRNKLRHDVIPVLKKMNPSLLQSFQKTLKQLQGSEKIVANTLENIKKNTDFFNKKDENITLNIANWHALKNHKTLLFELLQPYGFTDWDAIFQLMKTQSGRIIYSKNYRLIKDREQLILSKNVTCNTQKTSIQENDTSIENMLLETVTTSSKNITKTLNEVLIDKDLLKFPLKVRNWKKGDYFYPLGMQGKKKISKFFKDEKLSLLEKEQTKLLISENNIVWVVGKRLDNRYKVTSKTKNILKITRINVQ